MMEMQVCVLNNGSMVHINFSLAVHVEVQPEANTVADGGNPGEDDQL